MGIQIISMNKDGVTTRNIEELSKDELIDIELAIMTSDPNDNTLLCIKCHKPFQGGVRSSYCETHR